MTMDKISATHKRSGFLTASMLAVFLAITMVLAACQPAAQPAQSQDQSAQSQGFGGGNGQRPNFQMQPAPELPTTQPVVRGFVAQHTGDNLDVQTGNPNFRQGQGSGQGNGPRPTPNGTPRVRPTMGASVTVKVSSDTVVYEDVTFASLNGQPPSGTIQQKVEKSSLDALPANARVTVWGDQNGDQVTAKVIVFTQFRGGGGQQQQPQTQ